MDRRDFIRRGLLAATVGAVAGPKAIAQVAEKQSMKEQLTKNILNPLAELSQRILDSANGLVVFVVNVL